MRRAPLLALLAAGCAHYSLDPADAGPDFALQGEYAAPGASFAAQVIARGEGRFDAVLLGGGLPGEGWDGRQRVPLQGGAEELAGSGYAARLGGGSMELRTPDGGRIALRRVERESPTLGEPPPADAVMLFEQAEPGVTSSRTFGDFRLHLEFLVPFAPKQSGQWRGNSGVYLQGRYELQVLDSFGLEGLDDECGALYRQRRPDVNMALPPLAWQTYDVEFRAARFGPGGDRLAPARV